LSISTIILQIIVDNGEDGLGSEADAKVLVEDAVEDLLILLVLPDKPPVRRNGLMPADLPCLQVPQQVLHILVVKNTAIEVSDFGEAG
jgi:hypothetical protein